MATLTAEAQDRLQEYLNQVRLALRGCGTVDADDVERDVMEHIRREFQEKQEPVSRTELESVLGRLGSPEQWVPEEELPWWRRAALQLRTGPEDYRLAYLSLGLLVLGFLLGPGAFLGALLASFCASRAALSVAEDRDELGPQRWLLYPSLIIVYAGLAPLVLAWVVWLPVHLEGGLARVSAEAFWLAISLGLGAWWVILGLAAVKWPDMMRTTFRPFGDWFDRKWAKRLIYSGLALALGGTAAVLVVFWAQG